MTLTDRVKTLLSTLPELESCDDGFVYRFSPDPTDRLTDAQLQAIEDAEGSKWEAFYDQNDMILGTEVETVWPILMEALHTAWITHNASDAWDTIEDAVQDRLFDFVAFALDPNFWLKQTVYVNLMVNTGDENYDFTCNNLLDDAESSAPIPPQSSLLWLVQQQGYTVNALERAMRDQTFSDSAFLRSVYEECANTTTSMNALTFFVAIPLAQYLTLLDGSDDLILPAHTACGLWDPWHGAGGILEIVLDRPVTIPRAMVQPACDGYRGHYSVADTYGMLRRFWTPCEPITEPVSA